MNIRIKGRAWIGLIFFLLLLSSCSETSDDSVVEYPNWQSTNTEYWDNLYAQAQSSVNAGDASWRIYKSYSLLDSVASQSTDHIVVHVLQNGKGTENPLFTDSVRVIAKGVLLPSTSYPSGKVIFNTNPDNFPAESAGVYDGVVSGFIDGFTTALQKMHKGDEWEVYIPWTLGYKASGSGEDIPGYSVLKFTIQLVDFCHADSSLPDFKAKERIVIL